MRAYSRGNLLWSFPKTSLSCIVLICQSGVLAKLNTISILLKGYNKITPKSYNQEQNLAKNIVPLVEKINMKKSYDSYGIFFFPITGKWFPMGKRKTSCGKIPVS